MGFSDRIVANLPGPSSVEAITLFKVSRGISLPVDGTRRRKKANFSRMFALES